MYTCRTGKYVFLCNLISLSKMEKSALTQCLHLRRGIRNNAYKKVSIRLTPLAIAAFATARGTRARKRGSIGLGRI